MDRQNRNECPTLEAFGRWINNPVFQTFCGELAKTYGCKESMRYSACSWEPGWNLKFIRAGKTLCTVYPRNGYFTVLAVIGKKEKERVERLLPNMTPPDSNVVHTNPGRKRAAVADGGYRVQGRGI